MPQEVGGPRAHLLKKKDEREQKTSCQMQGQIRGESPLRSCLSSTPVTPREMSGNMEQGVEEDRTQVNTTQDTGLGKHQGSQEALAEASEIDRICWLTRV